MKIHWTTPTTLFLASLTGLSLATGCFASLQDRSAQIEKSIREQAAFDFNCQQDQLNLQKMDAPIGMYKYGVSGCGRKAPYNGGCDNLGSCNVARAGEVQSTQ